ncbi:MAG: tRNA (adenosine(37)-N6)-dimethylallyltransferase MiaA [Dehalococcoidia bacterium]|nr:tRNA (adenosine(37)-N6)-dimethylallyltransferase MiaA [Dehalococcoidia bacterium]
MRFPDHTPLLAIVGPTAVGKSALAIALARAFEGEIVNADSRQVYRLMDIGTAKPTAEEREQAPHHLLDLVDPDQGFSLALFLEHATQAIEAIHQRGHLPILVGGTGQYVWALLEGWQAPAVPPDPGLRQSLEAQAQLDGAPALYTRLQALDPEAAAIIHPHNLRRIIRALEVYDATGVLFSRQRRRSAPAHRSLILGLSLPREELYQRIDQRVERAVGQGWVGEVQNLLQMGFSPDLPALSSLGYRELGSHLRGEASLEEAVDHIKKATHRYARRQGAWFRRSDPRIHWLEAGPTLYEEAPTLVAAFLAEGAGPYGTIEPAQGTRTSRERS